MLSVKEVDLTNNGFKYYLPVSTKYTEKRPTITTYKELLLHIKQNKHNN